MFWRRKQAGHKAPQPNSLWVLGSGRDSAQNPTLVGYLVVGQEMWLAWPHTRSNCGGMQATGTVKGRRRRRRFGVECDAPNFDVVLGPPDKLRWPHCPKTSSRTPLVAQSGSGTSGWILVWHSGLGASTGITKHEAVARQGHNNTQTRRFKKQLNLLANFLLPHGRPVCQKKPVARVSGRHDVKGKRAGAMRQRKEEGGSPVWKRSSQDSRTDLKRGEPTDLPRHTA